MLLLLSSVKPLSVFQFRSLFSLLQGRSHCKQALGERSTHILLLLLLPHLIFFFFQHPPAPPPARSARVVVHDFGGARAVRHFGLRFTLPTQNFDNSDNFRPIWTYDTWKWGRILRWFQKLCKFWNLILPPFEKESPLVWDFHTFWSLGVPLFAVSN